MARILKHIFPYVHQYPAFIHYHCRTQNNASSRSITQSGETIYTSHFSRSGSRLRWASTRCRGPPAPLTGNKHTYTGHPLPDFCLQNTCKFAVKSASIWNPIVRRLPCSTQDLLLHRQRLLKKCRRLPRRLGLPSSQLLLQAGRGLALPRRAPAGRSWDASAGLAMGCSGGCTPGHAVA
jgi:hypothetical protein